MEAVIFRYRFRDVRAQEIDFIQTVEISNRQLILLSKS